MAQSLIGLIEYSYQYTCFFGSQPVKNSVVKRAWLGEILEWVTDLEVFPGAHAQGQKCVEKTSFDL
jgi:hypothetical protein